MFFGYFLRIAINALILLAATRLISRKGSKPEFQDVFFVSLGIFLVNTLMILLMFTTIGWAVLIPIFAANIFILMKYLHMGVITAIGVLVLYQVISYLLPF